MPLMSKKRIIGKCALCGQLCALTYEHIPPKMAFNTEPAKQYLGTEFIGDSERLPWDMNGLRYDNRQQGSGKYSLCGTCNNNTGSWYADSYNQFAYAAAAMLCDPSANGANTVTMKNLYPLRIIKQICSMFCSVNAGFHQFDEIRSFVLDKERRYLDPRQYRISMYFTKSVYFKQLGMTIIGNIETGLFCNVSEITSAPLGFLFYPDASKMKDDSCFDITFFSSFGYDETSDIEFPIIEKEVNSWLPADFRSRQQIDAKWNESQSE